MRRTRLGALLVAALLVTAGCTGVSPTGGDASPSATAPDATPTTPTTGTAVWSPEVFPSAPPNLSDEQVENAAIAAEKVHVYETLSTEYDLTYLSFGYMYSSKATVLNRSDGRVYVAVEVRYSYSNGEFVADGASSRALYHANETAIRRVGGLDEYPETTAE